MSLERDDPTKPRDEPLTPETMAAEWSAMPASVEDESEPEGGTDRLM